MDDSSKPVNDSEKPASAEKVETSKKKEDSLGLPEAQDALKQFDAFEVEDMPESNELQERRRKIKNQLKDLDMEANPEDGEGAFVDEDEGSLLDILREAGLGARQLKFCCSGVLVVGVLGLLIYGGLNLFGPMDFSFDSGDEETSTPETVTPADDDDDETNPVFTYPDPTLFTGMVLGESSETDTGTTTVGEDIGLEGNGDDPLQEHINDFSKAYEVAQVDVNELLSQSANRREALQTYVDQLTFYEQKAVQSQSDLQGESDLLSRQFSSVEEEKNAAESLYFDQLESLDAYASVHALDDFVAYAQELIRLRAHYLGRQKLLGYYEQVIPYIETKLHDIELNEEALVKGIKVVEVQGSDLDLIQQEADL